jgi:ABC-type antimicrobial peptide transport system permease subunit
VKLTDQLLTGSRNLGRQKIRTSLTIFAIVIGAVSVTVMLSLVTSAKSFLMTSFERTGEDRRIIVTPTPGLSYREATWNNWKDGSGTKLTDDLVAELAKIRHVESVTPYLGVQIFESLSSGTIKLTLRNTQIVGYEPNGTILRELVAGRSLQPSDTDQGVIISTNIADELGFKDAYDLAINTNFTLNPRTDMGTNIAPVKVTIVGVTNATNGKSIEMTLDMAKSMDPVFERCDGGASNTQPICTKENNLSRNGYPSVYLSVDNKKNIDQVMLEVKTMSVGVAAGRDEVQAQQAAFTIIGAVLGGIGAIALFVAAIGVINTMVMATLERTREIGILRAIGATKSTIRRLFTIEASLLGFIGGALGVALSFGVAMAINQVLNNQLADSGISARNVVSVPIGLALIVIAVTTIIGMLAARLPARRAANLDPVEALRYE